VDLSRRLVLQSGGLALASVALAPSFLLRTALAQTRGARGRDRPILIAVFQRGAADGLSMVVPFGDSHYYRARPDIAIAAPGRGDAAAAIGLDGFFGLHPALAPLKPLFDAGRLAVVHAVGSPHHTRSHFDAQDYMEAATPGDKHTPDGWLNRCLQAKPAAPTSPFRAVAFAPVLPRSLMGRAPALAMTDLADFGVRGGQGSALAAQAFEALYAGCCGDLLQRTAREAFEAVKLLKKADPRRYPPAGDAIYPRGPFGRALLQTAQLIKAEVGLEVAFLETGGWDTHADQGAARGQLADRLREFGQGLAAFCRDLGDRLQRIVVLTMTEFGRTARQNGSGGTDHGHASCLFVLGGPVKGGKVYGRWPGLAPEQLHEGRDVALTTDFRDVFAEVVARHLGVDDLTPIFPGFQPNEARFRGVIDA
jgi:uncharacterized protein (DUF1501 family)